MAGMGANQHVDEFQNFIDPFATKLAEVLREAMIDASNECKTYLSEQDLVGQLTDVELAVRTCLRHYYEFYDDYDLVIFPSWMQTGVGEQSEVDVIRFSPADVEDEHGMEKLAGTSLYAFGGFLQTTWRSNDILWGRLHSAERILTTFLGKQHPHFRRLLEQAQSTIIAEEQRVADPKQIVASLVDEMKSAGGEAINDEARGRLEEQLSTPPHLPMSKDALRKKFFENAPALEKLDSQAKLRLMGRGTQVIGKMMQDLTVNYPGQSLAAWVTRVGQAFSGLVEVSIPDSLSHRLFRHWVSLIYLFQLVLFVVGSILLNAAIREFAATTFAITLALHVGSVFTTEAMGQWKQGSPWKQFVTSAKYIVFAVVAVLAMIGAFQVWDYWMVQTPSRAGTHFGRAKLVLTGAVVVTLSVALARRTRIGKRLPLLFTAAMSFVFVYAAVVVDIIKSQRPWSFLSPMEWLTTWWANPPF